MKYGETFYGLLFALIDSVYSRTYSLGDIPASYADNGPL